MQEIQQQELCFSFMIVFHRRAGYYLCFYLSLYITGIAQYNALKVPVRLKFSIVKTLFIKANLKIVE